MLAGAELRQLVTRNALTVVTEGVPRLVLPGGQSQATFGEGCPSLSCQGSEMTAMVRLERHDGEPARLCGSPLQPDGDGLWVGDCGCDPRKDWHLVPWCDLSARSRRPRPGRRSLPDQELDHLAFAAPGVSHHSPAEPSSRDRNHVPSGEGENA